MLRITISEPKDHTITLRLEGQLAGRWVKELEIACVSARTGGAPLSLDLAGVSFIEHDGLEMLRGLEGVRLVNPSPFVTELLKGAGL